MCGLAGVIISNKKRTDAQRQDIASTFGRILVNAQKRGRHATGYVKINSDNSYDLFKRATSADSLVKTSMHKTIMADVDSNTTAILGHTRYATKGSPKVNSNNHPIRAGKIIGTHNGSIWNDEELVKKYDVEKFADVDSEVLFRLLNETPNVNDFADNVLPHFMGKITSVWYDVSNPKKIYVLKGNNPLEMVYCLENDVLYYASKLSYILSEIRMPYHECITNENTLYTFNTDELTLSQREIGFNGPSYNERSLSLW